MIKVTIELWQEDSTYDLWIHHFLTEIEARAFALGWRMARKAHNDYQKVIIRIDGKEV